MQGEKHEILTALEAFSKLHNLVKK